MAATQSIYRSLGNEPRGHRALVKKLNRLGATLDSATAPTNVSTTAAKMKRAGIGARRRKLMVARQHLTVT